MVQFKKVKTLNGFEFVEVGAEKVELKVVPKPIEKKKNSVFKRKVK